MTVPEVEDDAEADAEADVLMLAEVELEVLVPAFEAANCETAHATSTITSSRISAISGHVQGLRRRRPSSGSVATAPVAGYAPVGGAPA